MIRDFAADGVLALQHSETESRRFGFSVARLLVPIGQSHSDDAVVALVCGSSDALLIVRAESTRTSLFRELESLDGFECLHADILVYYRWSIDSDPVSDTTPEQFEISDHPSWAEVESVLTESFSEYRNHYSANSRLASSVTLSGYQEWAAGLMSQPNTLALVARDSEVSRAIGFVLLTVDSSAQLAEVALNAVRPSAQRGGVYSALMREARRRMKSRNDVRNLYISTQSENGAVVSAWQKLGLTPHLTLNTYHLMRRDAFGGAATP